MMMKLSDVGVGNNVKVVKVSSDESLKKKILSMGILPGDEIFIDMVAPFGSPVVVKTKSGFKVALRIDEASKIIVEK